MSKIGIIIQREYTTRVLKKSFLLLTFLTPLLFTAMIMVPVCLSSIKDDRIKEVVVIDKTELYSKVLKTTDKYTFTFSEQSVEELRDAKWEAADRERDLTAILYISEDLAKNEKAATLYSDKQIDVELPLYISNLLNDYVKDQKLASYDIPELKEKIKASQTNIQIGTIKWGEDGKEKQTYPELAMVLGMVSAFLIYMFIMNYGSQVMSGVLQEKTSRIVEVMISSVKPFELMMGKIVGVALVGLTQFLLWIVLTAIISSGLMLATGIQAQPNDMQTANAILGTGGELEMATKVLTMLQSIDLVQTLILFVVYFLGGYLLYSSFFAAIGSAVDNETDTQQFTTPITIPIIFGIMAAMYSVQNPNGPLAFWCSMIPFTSPIVMMVRIPFDVPMWELALSISLLIASFVGSTWLAGKIYRTGILMYGKKITWKELWKWIRQS